MNISRIMELVNPVVAIFYIAIATVVIGLVFIEQSDVDDFDDALVTAERLGTLAMFGYIGLSLFWILPKAGQENAAMLALASVVPAYLAYLLPVLNTRRLYGKIAKADAEYATHCEKIARIENAARLRVLRDNLQKIKDLEPGNYRLDGMGNAHRVY